MHEFQTLTDLQEGVSRAQSSLVDAMRRTFYIGAAELVMDAAERYMPVEVRHICDGSMAGYLRVMPVNGKRTLRSMRTIHWTQIDRSGGDHE